MGTETISRYDNTIVWEMRGDDHRPDGGVVVMSAVVRTGDGDTVPLTRDGSLARGDHTTIAMQVVGVDPHSVVTANDSQFVTDEFGRVSFVVANASEIQVAFVDGGVSHAVMRTTSVPSSPTFVDSTMLSVVFVVCAISLLIPASRIPARRVPARRVHAHQQRRSRGVST